MRVGDAGGDFIIDRLNEYGFKAYYVGGCVRDNLLELPVSDYDITTNCLPEQLIKIFKDYKVLTIGIKHGTVSIIINNKTYEVTTFRKESEYLDNRHPSKVEFCNDLRNDLSRRDFCCNALAFNKKEGLIDYFNGFYDLKNKVIRAVGDANLRFREDALRILRALRFSSKLNFNINDDTKKALFDNYTLLQNISSERILFELKGILLGKNSFSVLVEFETIIKFILPVLNNLTNESYHKGALLVSNSTSIAVKLACLFISLEAKDTFEALKMLKCDNTTINLVLKLLDLKDIELKNKTDVKIILNKLSALNTKFFFEFKRAIFLTTNDNDGLSKLNDMQNLLEQIINDNECYSLKQLAIKGDDVAKHCNGNNISKYLNLLLNAVIRDEVENNKESLERLLIKLL